jgi:preprotein translocase subunit YajC
MLNVFNLLLFAGPSEGGGGIIGALLPLLLIIVVFYFFIIRPQRKREQEKEEMIDALEKGDSIITVGGMHGKIKQINDTSVLAQVDSQVKVRIEKEAISRVPSKEDNS